MDFKGVGIYSTVRVLGLLKLELKFWDEVFQLQKVQTDGQDRALVSRRTTQSAFFL